MTETRPIELRASKNGVVEGTVVTYGDVATGTPTGIPERFERGSLALDSPALNFLHDRAVEIAPRVQLTDTPEALTFEARLTDEFREPVRGMIASGLLTGASMEFRALKERMEAGVRVIELARIEGLALVDIPAYPQSGGLQMRRADDTALYPSRIEYRQTNSQIRGVIQLGVAGIVSLAHRRKLLIPKDADLELADDIFLLDGYDYGKPIASTAAGSLAVRRTADAIIFETVARRLARTPELRNFRAKLTARLVKGVVPGLQRLETETRQDGDGFTVEVIREAGLCELNATARSGSGYSGRVSGGRRRRGV